MGVNFFLLKKCQTGGGGPRGVWQKTTLFPFFLCTLPLKTLQTKGPMNKPILGVQLSHFVVEILQLCSCFLFMERVVLIILDIFGGVQTFPTSSNNFTCAEVAFAGRTLNTRIKHTIHCYPWATPNQSHNIFPVYNTRPIWMTQVSTIMLLTIGPSSKATVLWVPRANTCRKRTTRSSRCFLTSRLNNSEEYVIIRLN